METQKRQLVQEMEIKMELQRREVYNMAMTKVEVMVDDILDRKLQERLGGL
jgi:hypothetical protein